MSIVLQPRRRVTSPLATGERDPKRMRSINDDVRRVVRADPSDRIPFFCECAEDGCYQPLWLTLGEYDRLAAGGSYAQSSSHDPAPPPFIAER